MKNFHLIPARECYKPDLAQSRAKSGLSLSVLRRVKSAKRYNADACTCDIPVAKGYGEIIFTALHKRSVINKLKK